MKHTRFLTASALAIVSATAFTGGAQAGVIDITSVVGTWQNVVPSDTTNLTNTYDGGSNTASLRWGTPIGTQQSGYDFKGVAPPTAEDLAENSVFNLGDFTHLNFPISSVPTPPSISSAQLSLSIDFIFDGTAQNLVSVFDFAHNETPNNENPCADRGANGVGVNVNGCADSVTVTTNIAQTESFLFGDQTLTFEVSGFDIPGGGNIFWTAENQPNTAPLQGRFSVEPIAPVPLPAAGWLLLAGIGALGALRRFRKT